MGEGVFVGRGRSSAILDGPPDAPLWSTAGIDGVMHVRGLRASELVDLHSWQTLLIFLTCDRARSKPSVSIFFELRGSGH